jgi:hypothetical protein
MRLLLLMKLLHELLDLRGLLHSVAPGVVYRTLWSTRVVAGWLVRPLVASWATTPPAVVAAATAVGALASDLLLPSTFFFFFLFLFLLLL